MTGVGEAVHTISEAVHTISDADARAFFTDAGLLLL
jgi:hypothetical protein